MPFLATASSVACRRGRAVDDFGIDAGLHGFEHVAAGQVDRRGLAKREAMILALLAAMSDADHQRHIAAGQVVGFERLARDALIVVQAGLHGHDLRLDDHVLVHLAEGHADQVPDRDARAGEKRLNPQPEIVGEHRHDDQQHEQHDDGDDHRANREDLIEFPGGK